MKEQLNQQPERNESDECPLCGAHISEPHYPDCARSPQDSPDYELPATSPERLALEEKIQAALGHVATSALIRRMETAQDFGYDDEEVELSRRLREQGKTWRWSDDFYNPRVVIEGGES
ncbi:hypothetical protein GS464_29535 [Rhodococcus hoagii]|nr:hypothetical protein [Prescottella equi]